MRRRLAALLAATLVAGALAALTPAGPASATTAVCAGTGTAGVTPGLLYPIGLPLVTLNLRNLGGVLGQRVIVTFNNELTTASWGFNFGLVAACLPGLTALTANGNLKGYCGHSTGSGTTNTGQLLGWTSLGSFLLLTNEVTGVVNAIPDAVGGESCLHGGSLSVHTDVAGDVLTTLTSPNPLPAGATRFLIQGAAILAHCNTDNLTTTLPLSLGTVTTLDALTHITIPLPNLHVSVHPCTSPRLTLP